MPDTHMSREIAAIPAIVGHQLQANADLMRQVVADLRQHPPRMILTVGRGSSDCVATLMKYGFENVMGWPVASSSPSIASLYGSCLSLDHAWVVGISQSGQSPDLCEMFDLAKRRGARSIAFVNQVDSPLARMADVLIPLQAGPEKSVAATKSFVCSLSAFLQFLTFLSNDESLQNALSQLPDYLCQAQQMDWGVALDQLKERSNALILARGYGLAIAEEAALKLKETSLMHAEAYSIAAFMHGPLALLANPIPLLAFVQDDQATENSLQALAHFRELGASVLLALPHSLYSTSVEQSADVLLPLPDALHPCLDPVVAIQAFYGMAEALARARGHDPDRPNFLNKVTETR